MEKVVIFVLLVVLGLYYYLICNGFCIKVGLVLEFGELREVYYFVVLFGYGCGVINFYLVFEILDGMIVEGLLVNVDYKIVCKNYIKVVIKGVIKVVFKIGIFII